MSCPEVVLLRKHVLVMSFIGTDHNPAPTLKEAKLTPSQLQSAYDQCIKVSMKILIHLHYNKRPGDEVYVSEVQVGSC